MMSVGDLTVPERMQTDDGPLWAGETEFAVKMLNYDLAQALVTVVRVQHDLRLNRNTLLVILRSLASNNVAYAKRLVAPAEALGGAHGMIEHLTEKFVDMRVLIEVHDLLVQVTRSEQVHMVLKLLERQFTQGVDTEAMRELCYAGGPLPSHLNELGTTLSQILVAARPELRETGYAAYAEERDASANAGSSMLVYRDLQHRGAGSSSSSNATGSEASSPGSAASSKRHGRSRSAGRTSGSAREGACVAGSSDS